MTGRRGVGRPPAKRVAVANTAKSAQLRNRASLLAQERRERQLRGEAPGEAIAEDDEVTLLYRRPSTRTTKTQRGATAATSPPAVAGGLASGLSESSSTAEAAGPASVTAAPTPEESVLAFLRRATGTVNLSRYLTHCGVTDIQLRCSSSNNNNVDHDSLVFKLTQQQVFHCSSDRLETAMRALWNLEALLFTPADTSRASGAPWVGQTCWVQRQHQQAVVALARVCEAAVPLQLPSMVDLAVMAIAGRQEKEAMMWTLPMEQAGGLETKLPRSASALGYDVGETNLNRGSEDESKPNDASSVTPNAPATCKDNHGSSVTTVQLVPSPVRLCEVHRRLRCLRRLAQLRIAYGRVLPRLHSASSLVELRRALFAHDAAACTTLSRLRQLWMAGSSPFTSSAIDLGHHFSSAVVKDAEANLAHTQALSALLSSFLGNPALLDTLLPLVGISARHPQEEALLQHLVALLKKRTAVEAATWGPMAAMASWRCTDGLYVIQHASRVRALRRVLAEAQFYGLPRFLRSIRAAPAMQAAAAVASTNAAAGVASDRSSGGGDDSWLKPTALLRAQARYVDQFFLTPDTLDPTSFTQPDPMQTQLVQEELITLQRTHCAFCLVVGEADEIVSLVHGHLACAGHTWQQLTGKKKEEEADEEEGLGGCGDGVKAEPSAGDDDDDDARDGETNEEVVHLKAKAGEQHGGPTTLSSSVLSSSSEKHKARKRSRVDPLHRYVLRTVDAARHHDQSKKQEQQQQQQATSPAARLPFCQVQWVEGGSTNLWSPHTHYYGVVYMVVLETDEWETEEVSLVTEGLLPGTAITIEEERDSEALRPPRPPTYCVNAMLELWRS